ncbi:MAG: cytochrome-c peroxidase, partial [Planctomycetota bacterium]
RTRRRRRSRSGWTELAAGRGGGAGDGGEPGRARRARNAPTARALASLRLPALLAAVALPARAQTPAPSPAQQPAAAPTPTTPPTPHATPPAPSFAFLTTPPAGLPPMPKPDGYTPTAAMFALGERLFFDPVLSRDRTVSCASCHPAATGFAHPDPLPKGIDGQLALRHAPALWNRGYGTRQRWDGASASLEAFVLEPIADARAMGFGLEAAVERRRADPHYGPAFAAAFAAPADAQGLQRALATYVRGIALGDAPYDRFLRGDADALTPQQRHGQWIFESKGGCWQCHTPPLFTDEGFHNTGVGARDGAAAPGRMAATGHADDRGRFKTPTLRGLRLSAPYMHDGSQRTLADVVAFYARGGEANAHLDPKMRKLDLSAADRAALVAFLESL